jgi:DNA-binding NtrC family response regulator
VLIYRRNMGKVALVVEDELFIVLELEDLLNEAGYADVVATSTVSDALAWLDSGRADLAIVDYRLRDATSERLIDRLIFEKIPTVIYSGNDYSDDVHNSTMKHLEWISKPSSPELIQAAIDRATR